MLAGYCLYLLLQRDWKRAAMYALCGVPALIWFGYVRSQTGPDQTTWIAFPMFGIVQRLMHPEQYPVTSRWLAVASRLDYLAVLGVLAALVLSARLMWNREKGLLEILAITFAVFVTLLSKPDIWSDAFSFGRIASPLLIFLAMIGAIRRKPIWLLPLLMVLPRVLLQLKATI